MMFNKLSIASVLALATLTIAYPNKYCSAGKYHSAQGSVLVCKDCPAGHFRQTGFSSTVPTTCDPCPAGKYQDDEGKSTCDSCRKGTFAANPGTTRCTNCPKGTFVDHTGAKGCCSCCAGYYQDNTGQDECKKCSNNGNGFRKYSAPGSDSYGDCHYQQDSDNGVTLVSGGCGMVGPGDKTCPAVLPSGPIGSQVAKKKRSVSCPSGKKACSRLAGVGGFDCVDISANVESCGGCVDYDAAGHADVGKDCTAIPGVSTAKCVRGGCVIDSCKKGFVLADDQSSCISTSPVTVQDASSRRRSRRDML